MKIAVEFDLTNAAIIVHWPWGSHSFPHTPEGVSNMAEALQRFYIESSRRFTKLPQVIDPDNLLAIRNAMEASSVKVQRYVEKSSKKEVPGLDELFGDDEFFGVPNGA